MAVLAETQGNLGFPFYFPALRKTGSRYASPQPRIYTIRDEQNKPHKAYRLVLYAGSYGEYYGVQGMSWRYPPILDDPDRVHTVGSRKLLDYFDGKHLRLVAWRTPKAVYWVTNTLTQSIPNSRLVAIAASLTRLKQLARLLLDLVLAVGGDLHVACGCPRSRLDDGVVAGAALHGRRAAQR